MQRKADSEEEISAGPNPAKPKFGHPISRRRALAVSGVAMTTALGLTGSSPTTEVRQAGCTVPPGVFSPPSPHIVLSAVDLESSGNTETGLLMRSLIETTEKSAGSAEIMVGLGSSFFDKAELVWHRPSQLRPMPSFPGDLIDPSLSHGDVLIQIGAMTAEKAQQVTRSLLNGVGGLRSRWSMAGFRPMNTIDQNRAVTRNLFGFTEGYGNPDMRDVRRLAEIIQVQESAGEPSWCAGGTYQVVRVIRMSRALWDADSVTEQEKVIGRRRDGSWLDGTAPYYEPRFADDSRELATPIDSHVRRANPRQPGLGSPPILRCSYSYSQGTDTFGHPDDGLLFICFQGDMERGFEAVQNRLTGEALSHYVLTVGGGYFFVPPIWNSEYWREEIFRASEA